MLDENPRIFVVTHRLEDVLSVGEIQRAVNQFRVALLVAFHPALCE